MEEKEVIEEKLKEAYSILINNLDESFQYISSHPDEKKETIKIWSNFIRQFMRDAIKLSEKNNEKDLIKTVTKAIMFGR
ncbi:hypothetical protein [Caldisalinibacter kiritimatiensis]|uniref:Uncharacterized protein n=1 Tax=Caldisalinibacter kiritimatiensis TaxID=1304284 RepID=R1CLG6_9FIRM|nr:hypothetical protein [Caldisalinibacter kiritimatiensis]EOC99520.1 hypothetical protein L21TH_2432 [Caldisalinibacter kiritimatiensis]